MIVIPLSPTLAPDIEKLMEKSAPYITVRSSSDYWMYATLFSKTCPVAISNDIVAGAAIAFRSQDNPGEIYIQDVATEPRYRGQGTAGKLLSEIQRFAIENDCKRLFLTSEPGNSSAHRAWCKHGFVNVPGTNVQDGIHVTADFKGPGKDRAVYELTL